MSEGPRLPGRPTAGCPVPHGHDLVAGRPADARCPFPPGQSPPGWSEEALARVQERVAASGMDPDRARALALTVTEERARRRQQEITELFVRTLGRKLGYGHPLSERTGTLRFEWTAEAEARLAEIPEFCRELTRWRVEWTAEKLGLGSVITPDVMETKFEMWGRVSHAIEERRGSDGLPWTDSARARFAGVPEFVRGQVLEAVEGNARHLGAAEVDDGVIDTVIERWIATGDFHEGLYGFR